MENKFFNELKRCAVYLCVFSLVINPVLLGLSIDPQESAAGYVYVVLFFMGFYVALPVVVLCILWFVKKGRMLPVMACSSLIPYVVLMCLFWSIARGEAAKDAQGALIYVFGPIYIHLISVAFALVFGLIYFIVRLIREKTGRLSQEGENRNN